MATYVEACLGMRRADHWESHFKAVPTADQDYNFRASMCSVICANGVSTTTNSAWKLCVCARVCVCVYVCMRLSEKVGCSIIELGQLASFGILPPQRKTKPIDGTTTGHMRPCSSLHHTSTSVCHTVLS